MDQPLRWRPRRIRGDAAAEEKYAALFEGVPAWLRQSVFDWVMQQIEDRGGNPLDLEDVKWLERRLHLHLDWVGTGGPSDLRMRLAADDDLLLDVTDALLSRMRWRTAHSRYGSGPNPAVVELTVMLTEAGSAWTVESDGDTNLRLARRVNETVAADAKAAMGHGPAGSHLRAAWNAAFGRAPNASMAYREAVRAVEAAACPVALPNDSLCTLGKVIAHLRDAPQQWEVAVTAPDGFDAVGAVRGICELLWKGQVDRHGKGDPDAPLSVSQPEAETAVHLAVTLVQLFATGAVRPR